jgi:nucleoside-diphosphate-sugar epimerase
MPQRVLVTGGLGYLGSILCEHLLAAGFRVTALDNLTYGTGQQGLFHLCAHPDFDFLRGDVRDEALLREALRGADVIVHLAAIVGAAACDRDPALASSVNLKAVALLNRLRSPNQLIVFPNTNSGYGTTGGTALCTEDSPLRPISLYGRTKVQAERLLLDSPNAIALRLATVFGMSPRMRLEPLRLRRLHRRLPGAVREGLSAQLRPRPRRRRLRAALHRPGTADGRPALQRRPRRSQPLQGAAGAEGAGARAGLLHPLRADRPGSG